MIKQAQLDWSDGTPISTDFDDVYFSKASGLEETKYVFLEQNQLPSRWENLKKDHFTIAETGFGTGLNFLCAWDLWLQHSQPHQHLHFVTVEKFPINQDNLKQALSHWPELSYLSEILINHYPPLVPGWHTLHLPNPQTGDTNDQGGQIVLHLFFGDIHDWLPQIEASVDAWFLDGFAPSKNPEMWTDQLFLEMSRLSPFGGTVATFTAAGLVKRGLKAAGFEVKKAKGFGKKRDMLIATQMYCDGPQPPLWTHYKPWLLPHPNLNRQDKSVVIIGAGIAGCSTAYSFAKRGWQVTVIEKNAVASGASGNAQGVLYAKLAAEMNLHSQFYLAGYLYSLELLKQTLPEKKEWDNCGVLQLATNEKEDKRQQTFQSRFNLDEVVERVSPEKASEIAGTLIEHSGLFFKDGAWVYPAALCRALIDHENIQLLENTNANKISQLENQQWEIALDNSETLTSDILVICNGHDAQRFLPINFLPTKPVAGQVTQLEHQTIKLNTVLCGDHYVTPTHNDHLNFGASYRLKSEDTTVLDEENRSNIDNLKSGFPSVGEQIDESQPVSGRASIRCTSPDYTPIVGAVCDPIKFEEDFSELKKNRKWRFQKNAHYLNGLYLNLGHGSRGLSSAPLCGELIVSSVTGEPLPITREQMEILSPNRCLVNQITKP